MVTALDQEDIDRIAWSTTELLRRRMEALQRCSMLPGSFDKAFVRNVCFKLPASLTLRQQAIVLRLTWRYRRQISKALHPTINPDDPLSPDAAIMVHSQARRMEQPAATNPGGHHVNAPDHPTLFQEAAHG